MGDAYRITEKQERYTNVDAIKEDVTNTLLAENESLDVAEINDILSGLEKKLSVREC